MEVASVIWLGMLVTVVLGVQAAVWIAPLFAVVFAAMLVFAWATK